VAISVDYRIATTHRTTPFESAQDARDALAWVRQHAVELAVDPDKIVLAGASAGGHLAAVTALTVEKPEVPAALLLLYPILDTSPAGFGHGLFGDRFAALSPLHLLRAKNHPLPPTLILVGDADSAVPVKTVRDFQATAEQLGSRCEVVIYPGGKHPLYSYRSGGEPLRSDVLAKADRFLQSLGIVPGPVH
jgi:acetyl esterase/lipase